MSDTNKNTLRIIQAANRSLDLHRSRLSAGRFEENANILFNNNNQNSQKYAKKPLSGVDPYLDLEPPHKLKEPSTESSHGPSPNKNTIENTEEKVKQLEERISTILEYSSKLEETLKQNLNSSTLASNNHCCCQQPNTTKNRLDERKIASLVKKAISSFSRRNQPQITNKITPNPKKPPLFSKPKTFLTSKLPLEDLTNYILDSCLEDTICSLDSVLHSISVRFIRDYARSNIFSSPHP
ncbi:hypothetical protein HWI79_2763 [Cryptosporidium felis]|nr:hypothetical protein HWI79_2763 [Cryptosporidium felis]